MNSWEIFSKIIILTKKPIVLHWLHWIFIKIYDFFQKWSFNLDCLFQKKWYFWSKSDFEEKWNRNYLILGTVSCIFFSLIIFSVQFFLYIIFFVYCLLLLFVLWEESTAHAFIWVPENFDFLYFGAREHNDRNERIIIELKSEMDSSDKIGK